MKLSLLLWAASFLPQPTADHICLATTVYLEARDQPMRGQIAVAEVALRRQESSRNGESLCAVLLKPKQFAMTLVSPNKQLNNPKAWSRAWQVAVDTMRLWQLPYPMRKEVVPGASHFVASRIQRPAWAVGEPIATIGDHDFYRVR
jgi:spore germination cell wall hydrolase CwlJ-like protein